MISIGIDVSKVSTICILKPYGELVKTIYCSTHKESLDELTLYLNNMKGEKRIFVEATGIYHLPIYLYL